MKKRIYVTVLEGLILGVMIMTMLSGCGKQDSSVTNEITGTWQTASMVPTEEGEVYPEYYVQFTDSSVNYGHMIEEEFVLEYSDEIVDLTVTPAGGYKVQAKTTKSGAEYTYVTSEDDADILEYYDTWNEEEFPDKYMGGASLSKCN